MGGPGGIPLSKKTHISSSDYSHFGRRMTIRQWSEASGNSPVVGKGMGVPSDNTSKLLNQFGEFADVNKNINKTASKNQNFHSNYYANQNRFSST